MNQVSYEYLQGMFEGFDYFQAKCNDTAIFPEDLAIEYLTLGLVSEAGEVADKIKKKLGTVSVQTISKKLVMS